MAITELVRRDPEDAVAPRHAGALSARELVQRSHTIQDVMRRLMKEGTHYGTIPGTPKPTLYQPGAELLRVTFQLAADLEVEDLSRPPDEFRYRVTARIRHVPSGEVIATGVGEASTDEEKYRWRSAVCEEEFEAAGEDRRRIKWKKGSGNKAARSIKQVRTEPADLANTALKMAAKRAEVGGTRSAVGASDIFAQDLDDLERVGIELEEEAAPRTVQEPRAKESPKPKPTNGKRSDGESKPAAPGDPEDLLAKASDRWHDRGTISEAQTKRLFAIAYKSGWKSDHIVAFLEEKFGVRPDELPWGDPYDAVCRLLETCKPDDFDLESREPGDYGIPFD